MISNILFPFLVSSRASSEIARIKSSDSVLFYWVIPNSVLHSGVKMSARSFSSILLGILFFVCITACGSAETPTTATLPTATISPPTEIPEPTSPPPTITQENPSPSPTMRHEPTPTPEPYVLPLSGFGPNFIGKRVYSFVDTSATTVR